MDYYSSLNASNLDPDIPTIFEILAVQQLQALIQPSVRYLVMHYAERNPAYMLRLALRFDELFAVAFGTVEWYHLIGWNSSFTERFYGLKRCRRLAIPTTLHISRATPAKLADARRLTRMQRILCLVGLVGIPYAREKLEARYERLRGAYAFRSIEEDRPAMDDPLKAQLIWKTNLIILKWWPVFKFSTSMLSIGLIASYMFRPGPATIEDLLIGTRYARLGDPDYRRMESTKGIVGKGLAAAGYALPTSLFVLKFLEWWSASDFGQNLAAQGPKLPPPTTTASSQSCGICSREDLIVPTALETGAVFCYKCIFEKLNSMPPPPYVPLCPSTGRRLLLTTWSDSDGKWQINGLRQVLV